MAPSQSGNLSIINATPFVWEQSFQHVSQMPQWDFPTKINPGDQISVSAAWGADQESSILARTNYTIALDDDTSVGFQFQAHISNDGPQFQVFWNNASTFGNPPGTNTSLGFSEDANTPFILSGQMEESFESSNPPQNWMHQNLPSIGCLPLNRICMPASHDAGMSHLNGHTALVNNEDTLTHFTDISGQLSAGFRYFDIRPVIADGKFATGHYSKYLGRWIGGNGQSIVSIISQINAFLDEHHELVILDLSHTFDTDHGFSSLTQPQLNALFTRMLDLKYRYIAPSHVSDLSSSTLNDLIADGPAVLVIADNGPANEHMEVGSYSDKGFYLGATLGVFNSFADTDDVADMVEDQISKMIAQSSKDGMFLLSWTLSTIVNVRQTALKAHAALFTDLWPSMTKNSFPNLIMLDGIGASDSPINPGNVAALSMAITHSFNDDCGA